jgi:DNA polymerase elongation subunit (family B)
MEIFVNKLIEFYNKQKFTLNEKCVYIFHWSSADVSYFNKTLKRYPNLNTKLETNCKYEFVDLLNIIKNTIDMESYSLKYVVKNLLNKNYDSTCQNGLDAMTSIINIY